jgi:uncharacterized membrane protein
MKLFVGILLFFLSLGACAKQPSYPEPPRSGNDVAVDIGMLRPEIPVFFTHRYQGKRISFFVVKVDDKVLSFFDACARCYPAKLGYRFESGTLICRECNLRYPVTGIEKGVGSCIPIRLEGSVQNGKYRVPLSALEKMVDKF